MCFKVPSRRFARSGHGYPNSPRCALGDPIRGLAEALRDSSELAVSRPDRSAPRYSARLLHILPSLVNISPEPQPGDTVYSPSISSLPQPCAELLSRKPPFPRGKSPYKPDPRGVSRLPLRWGWGFSGAYWRHGLCPSTWNLTFSRGWVKLSECPRSARKARITPTKRL